MRREYGTSAHRALVHLNLSCAEASSYAGSIETDVPIGVVALVLQSEGGDRKQANDDYAA
jgi:hypothetical protein